MDHVGRVRSGRREMGLPPWLYGGSVASLRCARWRWSLGPSLATISQSVPFLPSCTLAACWLGARPDCQPRARCAHKYPRPLFQHHPVSLARPNRPCAGAIPLGGALRWLLQADNAGSAGMLWQRKPALEPLPGTRVDAESEINQNC